MVWIIQLAMAYHKISASLHIIEWKTCVMQPVFWPQADIQFPNLLIVIDRASSDLNVNIKLRVLINRFKFQIKWKVKSIFFLSSKIFETKKSEITSSRKNQVSNKDSSNNNRMQLSYNITRTLVSYDYLPA